MTFSIVKIAIIEYFFIYQLLCHLLCLPLSTNGTLAPSFTKCSPKFVFSKLLFQDIIFHW